MNVNELKVELTNDLEMLKKKIEKANMWPMSWEQGMTQKIMLEFAIQQINKLDNLEYNRKVKVPAMIDLLIGDYWANHMQGHTTQDQLLNIIIEDWRIGFNTDEYWNEGIWIENNFCKFVDAVRCGHEVEEEPKWVIPLPSLKTSDGKQQFLSHDPHKDTYFASRKSVMVKQNFNKIELEDVPEQFKSYATPLVQL